MRICWVGILVLWLTSALLAQAEGVVESIGLDGYYRPECWVPMTVQLRPTSSSAAELEIRVVQEDLDHDRVVATRTVTVTPDVGGRSAEAQRFWMYFRPQPTDKGLADSAVGGSPKQLEAQLKIMLAEKNGGKVIANLPITQQGLKRVDVDPAIARVESYRPIRLVLCVTDGVSIPAYTEYRNTDGISDQPIFVMVRPRDLPEDLRGYEMIDQILWLGASAPDPSHSLEEPRYRALEQWVRQGGMMVVCQGPEAAKLKGFEKLLPVQVKEYRDSNDLQPLPDMGRLDWSNPADDATASRRVAFATAKPGAVVVREKTWPDGSSPFVARGAVGSGCVTWVAMDLGEGGVARALRKGWVRIWDEIFGWRNTPTAMKTDARDQTPTAFGEPGGTVDIGASFRKVPGGGLTMAASGYVLLAVLFFALYWVAAGPGMYAYLSLRKLPTLNWFLFGVVAVGAAFLAALVVRVIQSGSPELEHVTMVRVPADGYATVQSRISLLVHSDGLKELELAGTAPQTTNWITPYPEHPATPQSGETSRYLAMRQYQLPIEDVTSNENVRVSMPWRSTMKRIQARWNGDIATKIEGKVWLTGRMYPDITGTLANGTPWDLKNIYLVYRVPTTGDGSNIGGDKAIYIPKWPKGQVVDLAQILSVDKVFRIGKNVAARESIPGYDNVIYGGLELMHRGAGNEIPAGEGWVGYWYSNMVSNNSLGLSSSDDSGSGYGSSLPISSLFDRIPPMRNERDNNGRFKDSSRRDVARIGTRSLNVSPALAAENLVVIAQAKGPLPIPLTVDGSTPKGDGVILCQFLLPLSKGGSGVEK